MNATIAGSEPRRTPPRTTIGGFLGRLSKRGPSRVLSLLSVGSIASLENVLSVGSSGSILSIGSAGSALSFGVGSFPGRKNDAED